MESLAIQPVGYRAERLHGLFLRASLLLDKRLTRWSVAISGAMLVAALLVSQPVKAEPFAEMFGYPGEIQGEIVDFPKWTAVVQNQTSAPDGCDNEKPCNTHQWQEFLSELEGLPAHEQLEAVNRFVNSQDYVPDMDNYGENDYWATPGQFLANGGDCEDYAILKLFSLLRLGWPSEVLRLVVVQDTKLKMPHAVLAVSMGADVLVLDNQAKSIKSSNTIAHYAPVYSLSDKAWWLHSPTEQTSRAAPASR